MEENPSILSNKIYFNYCLTDVINFFLKALPLFPSLFKMWHELSKMISSNIAYLKNNFFSCGDFCKTALFLDLQINGSLEWSYIS